MDTILSRRSFLGRAMAATSVVALSGATTLPAEKPELRAIAAELDAADNALGVANQAKADALRRFEATEPARPADLFATELDGFAIAEKDCEGRRIVPERWILTATCLQLDAEDYGPRSKRGKEARRRLPIAEKFEADYAAALAASGLPAAIANRKQAADAVEDLAARLEKLPASTWEGVAIKARAIDLCEKVGVAAHTRALLYLGPVLAKDAARLGAAAKAEA